MQANEVKDLKWIHVTDWSELSMTYSKEWEEYFVEKDDIDSFVENVFKDVSRKLNIPYEKLMPILKEKNVVFYSTKEKLFKKFSAISKNNPRILKLQKMLLIPDITTVLGTVNKSTSKKS